MLRKNICAVALAASTLLPAGMVTAAPVGGYVVGGDPVLPSENYGWMASLRLAPNQLSHLCGATVIDRRWVLTAAHCVVHEVEDGVFQVVPPSALNVMVGSNYAPVEDPGTLYTITHVVVHPGYTPNPVLKIVQNSDGTQTVDVLSTALNNDVALLRVGREFASTIPVVRLADSNKADELDLVLGQQWSDAARPKNTRVSGWGSTQTDGTGMSDRLLKTDLSFVPMDECFQRLELGNEWNFILDSPLNRTKLCTLPPEVIRDAEGSSLEHGADSCKGDSGGPLRAQDQLGDWYQLGIVSGGPVGKLTCGSLARPSFYTRVGTYYDWITQQVGRLPEHPITAPDIISDSPNSGTGSGDTGDGGTSGGGTTPDNVPKDQETVDLSRCNAAVDEDAIAHTNCSLSGADAGSLSWQILMGLLALMLYRIWRARAWRPGDKALIHKSCE
ncbi:S1 family peptidase [Photobacterium sp. TY1-4]|uniref:S1 family peptidase n=1 Tax=Photobacterium sp. TY1-4 TaxID=2899122 RepID=UPI0021C1EC2F|nr:serine protease [Photobacterium sp. TY1-4]UXI03966.1 serine protease [Photobacterium sp. TY1-4]